MSVALQHTDAKDALDALKAVHPGRVSTCLLDLTSERGAASAITQTVQWGSRLDAVAHLMGGWVGGAKGADTSLGVWEAMMTLNLTSAFLLTRGSIPPMIEGGAPHGMSLIRRSARTVSARVNDPGAP